MTLFEKCVEAAIQEDDGRYPDYPLVVRRILETLRDNTQSPRTVDEMVRVLEEGVWSTSPEPPCPT